MKRCILGLASVLAALWASAAESSPNPAAPAAPDPTDALLAAGQELFDELAPPEVKEQFEFPDRAKWDQFVGRLQAALEGDNPAALAELETEVRTTLEALRLLPGSEEYLDWLDERLDYVEAAKEMAGTPPPKPPRKLPPGITAQFIPHYELWLRRLQGRARPAQAEKYVRALQPLFAAGGVPRELVWLAEVESGFNPVALSPAGARGLFQLMPATARELGLRTLLPDERKDPAKSAQAAARRLRQLHVKFGDWPLALAAYNAGPGRVQRALESNRAKNFADIAATLPLETRMYVPKVLAVLKVRAGVMLAGPEKAGKS
ncbi:MAG TPA: lytic transglycosylase domain-containing protein [Lacunisphaera sp.]|nr:lytic transglycosylase domain-containing protein [Lacunisphaera sp.]